MILSPYILRSHRMSLEKCIHDYHLDRSPHIQLQMLMQCVFLDVFFGKDFELVVMSSFVGMWSSTTGR